MLVSRTAVENYILDCCFRDNYTQDCVVYFTRFIAPPQHGGVVKVNEHVVYVPVWVTRDYETDLLESKIHEEKPFKLSNHLV